MASSAETAWLPPNLGPGIEAPTVSRSGALALPDLVAGPTTPQAPPSPLERARELGYEEGVRDGAASADRALDPVVEALFRVVGHIDAARLQFARDRERDLQALALAIARQLVQREVAADPTLLSGWIERAIGMLPEDAMVRIRLHPADLELLGPRLERLAPADRPPVVQWSGDPAVERGSFVAESPRRLVDGRLDVALRALYERFDAC